MKTIDQIGNKIEESLSNWNEATTIAEFIKKKLGVSSEKGKSHADEIIDNAIARAKYEEDPKWASFLFNNMKTLEDKAPPQTNFFIGAANLTDEGLKKIIDVTPVKVKTKSKIEELI